MEKVAYRDFDKRLISRITILMDPILVVIKVSTKAGKKNIPQYKGLF